MVISNILTTISLISERRKTAPDIAKMLGRWDTLYT